MRKIEVKAEAGKEDVMCQTVINDRGTTKAPIIAHP